MGFMGKKRRFWGKLITLINELTTGEIFRLRPEMEVRKLMGKLMGKKKWGEMGQKWGGRPINEC